MLRLMLIEDDSAARLSLKRALQVTMTTCRTVSYIPQFQIKPAAMLCLLSVLDWCCTPYTVIWGCTATTDIPCCAPTCPVLQLQAQMMPSLLPEYSCSTDTQQQTTLKTRASTMPLDNWGGHCSTQQRFANLPGPRCYDTARKQRHAPEKSI